MKCGVLHVVVTPQLELLRVDLVLLVLLVALRATVLYLEHLEQWFHTSWFQWDHGILGSLVPFHSMTLGLWDHGIRRA